MKFSWQQRGWPAQRFFLRGKAADFLVRDCGDLGNLRELWLSAPSPRSSYFWVAMRMPFPWSWEWLDTSDLETMAWPEHVGEPRRLAWVCGFLEGSEALFQGCVGRWNSTQCREPWVPGPAHRHSNNPGTCLLL